MDPLIEVHQVALVGDLALELNEELLDRLPVGASELLCRQPGSVRLEHDADLGDAGQIGDVDVGDERAAVGDRSNEVFPCEALEGFANRGPPDAELLAQPGFVDHRAGRHLQAHDPVEDACVRLLALRSRRDRFGDRHSPSLAGPPAGRYATDIPARNVAPRRCGVNWRLERPPPSTAGVSPSVGPRAPAPTGRSSSRGSRSRPLRSWPGWRPTASSRHPTSGRTGSSSPAAWHRPCRSTTHRARRAAPGRTLPPWRWW